MACIVTNGNVGTTTANGFYKTAGRNVYDGNGTLLALSSARQIAFTPDDTGNALGAVITLTTGSSAGVDKSVKVALQKNTGTWVEQDSKTLTATEISNYALPKTGEWRVPFTFTTGTTALTTAAGTWRLEITQTGGTVGNWSLETSDGTNPFFLVWTNTATSFASGDVICAKYPDICTLDQTTTLGPMFGTGATTFGVAALATRSTSLSTQPHCFDWTTSASITVSVDGHLMTCSDGGFRFGTQASPITVTNKGTLSFITPTGGGTTGGTRCCSNAGAAIGSFFQIWGQVPTFERTTLAADANASQANIVTTDACDGGAVSPWAIGDTIYIGKVDASGITDVAARTINSISGTAITLSSNLTQKRLAGATVIRTNGYGFKITSDANAARCIRPGVSAISLVLSGVENSKVMVFGVTTQGAASATHQSSSGVIGDLVSHVSFIPVGTSSTNNPFLNNYGAWLAGMTLEYINSVGAGIAFNTYSTAGMTGTLTFSNNVQLGGTATTSAQQAFRLSYTGKIVFTGNSYENVNSATCAVQCGIGSTYTNNKFYGCSGGAYQVDSLINPVDLSGDICDRSQYYTYQYGTSIGAINKNAVLGQQSVNIADATFGPGAYVNYEFNSPTGSVSVSTTNLSTCADGTRFTVTDNNDVTNADLNWYPTGYIVRTGTGLSDTTVHTAGGFGLRFESTNSTSVNYWKQTVPTGNIQNKTMMIGVWVKLNSANYYSGTNQMPRLTINYDNGTTAYAEAAQLTDWQFIFVPITPLTTFGQITATLSTMTDQTGSSAYVYFDDYHILYPEGYQLNLGNMDLWASGLPVMPTIATNLSAQDVWAVGTTSMGAGTIGEVAADALTLSDFMGLK